LTYQPVIVDVDVVDQAVDAVIIFEWGTHQGTQGGRIRLGDRAARHEPGRAGTQEMTYFNAICHGFLMYE
jgi:hypothetical protein